MMEYNLGFIMILLYYLFPALSGRKYHHWLVLILFPLFYYVAGAYALIFTVLYIVHNLSLEKGKQKYVYSSLLLIIAAVTFLVSWKFIFLQPVEQFLLFPLP